MLIQVLIQWFVTLDHGNPTCSFREAILNPSLALNFFMVQNCSSFYGTKQQLIHMTCLAHPLRSHDVILHTSPLSKVFGRRCHTHFVTSNFLTEVYITFQMLQISPSLHMKKGLQNQETTSKLFQNTKLIKLVLPTPISRNW